MSEETRKIPLKDVQETQNQPPKKRIGSGWLSFSVILFILAAIIISPIPSYLTSLIPQSVIDLAMSDIAQRIIIDESPAIFTEARKYDPPAPLAVLGRESGLCFTFNTLSKDMKNQAKQGRIIAEIIVISGDKKEYALDEVTLSQDKIICQTFSRKNSLVPETIEAIYIRPLSQLSPTVITWASIKDFR